MQLPGLLRHSRSKAIRYVLITLFFIAFILWLYVSQNSSRLNEHHFCQSYKEFDNIEALSTQLNIAKSYADPYCDKILYPNRSNEVDPFHHCIGSVIVQKKMGRLGNNICEYLSLRVYQILFNVQVSMDTELHNIITNVFLNVKIPKYNCNKQLNKISHRSLHEKLRESAISNELIGSHIITSYPCLATELMNYRRLFQKEIRFKNVVIENAKDRLLFVLKTHNISRSNRTLVSIHVRRTDYKRYMDNKFDRPLISSCYFQKAFHYVRLRFPNALFLVMSDDSKWCQENLIENDIIIVDTPAKSDPIHDFAFMTLCDHHIVSHGTFGFLSAYLGSGIIIHPYVVDDKLTDLENSLLCSDSKDLIAVPDFI